MRYCDAGYVWVFEKRIVKYKEKLDVLWNEIEESFVLPVTICVYTSWNQMINDEKEDSIINYWQGKSRLEQEKKP